jgi:hypothetical protein
MSVGIGRENIIILFRNFLEYINGNQTFILDFHRPFICSAIKWRQHGSEFQLDVKANCSLLAHYFRFIFERKTAASDRYFHT